MLNISFEFRKGIFFIRLIGDLNKDTFRKKEEEINDLIVMNKFKFVVININYLNTIDTYGIDYIKKIYNIVINNKNNLILCDRYNIIKKLGTKNIPNIKDELELL